jgi:hypothetical protein
MTGISSAPSTVSTVQLLQNVSSAPTAPAASPAVTIEPAPVEGGFALHDHSGNNSFAAQLRLPAAVKDYFYASSGAITEGHYTEF